MIPPRSPPDLHSNYLYSFLPTACVVSSTKREIQCNQSCCFFLRWWRTPPLPPQLITVLMNTSRFTVGNYLQLFRIILQHLSKQWVSNLVFHSGLESWCHSRHHEVSSHKLLVSVSLSFAFTGAAAGESLIWFTRAQMQVRILCFCTGLSKGVFKMHQFKVGLVFLSGRE